jgi:hypothetical protein
MQQLRLLPGNSLHEVESCISITITIQQAGSAGAYSTLREVHFLGGESARLLEVAQARKKSLKLLSLVNPSYSLKHHVCNTQFSAATESVAATASVADWGA